MKNTLHKRLQDNGRVVINPVASQFTGIFLSISVFLILVIIFENTVGEWSGGGWRWMWRIIFYPFFIYLTVKFFKAGLDKDVIPVGSGAVPRIFGKPQEKYLYGPGRYWNVPGKGNKPVIVDMRSESIELKINVTTADNHKMICPLNLNYHVYNPNVYAEVKDFVKTFQSMLSQAFLDLSSDTKAEDMLQLKKNEIRGKIVEAIKDIDGDEFKIEDFGIEIQESTISAGDGFDFADQKTRDAFESIGREQKQKIFEETESDHFNNLATKMVTASGGKTSFNEAFLRVQQLYGRNAPKENVVRVPGVTEEAVANVLSKIFKP